MSVKAYTTFVFYFLFILMTSGTSYSIKWVSRNETPNFNITRIGHKGSTHSGCTETNQVIGVAVDGAHKKPTL
jgi:hypothetical protein